MFFVFVSSDYSDSSVLWLKRREENRKGKTARKRKIRIGITSLNSAVTRGPCPCPFSCAVFGKNVGSVPFKDFCGFYSLGVIMLAQSQLRNSSPTVYLQQPNNGERVPGPVGRRWLAQWQRRRAERASRVLLFLQLRSCSSPSPTASCPFAILWMLGHSQRDRITKNKTPLPGAPPKLESEAPSELPSSPS